MKAMRVTVVVVGLLAGLAWAQNRPGARPEDKISVYGFATEQCGDYLANRAKNSQAINSMYAVYAWGFISATNLYDVEPAITGAISQGTILAFADKHCRDNPLSTFGVALASLIREKRK